MKTNLLRIVKTVNPNDIIIMISVTIVIMEKTTTKINSMIKIIIKIKSSQQMFPVTIDTECVF